MLPGMFAPRLAHPSIFDELWLAFWVLSTAGAKPRYALLNQM
jgi:hypothetical protein